MEKSKAGKRKKAEKVRGYFDEHSFRDKIIIVIITAIISSIVSSGIQFVFWRQQSSIEYQREITQEQIENISGLVRCADRIEMMREKIYWNKFYGACYLLLDDHDNADRTMNIENEYRVQYEDTTSEFRALLVMSQLLFKVDKDEYIHQERKILDSISFGFDFENISEQYGLLIAEGNTIDDAIEILEQKAQEDFSDLYYSNTMEYVSDLQKILESNRMR